MFAYLFDLIAENISMDYLCVVDFYDICDEVECTGPDCPLQLECRCPAGTVLGPDSQTCLGEPIDSER